MTEATRQMLVALGHENWWKPRADQPSASQSENSD
jgi:hypothetical protein